MVQFFSLLVSLFVFATSLVFPMTPLVSAVDGPLLNVSLISDTHVDASLPLGQSILATGFKDMSTADPAVDAVVVAGDLTQNGDDESYRAFFDIVDEYCKCENLVIATGNHDIGHSEATNEEARQYFINHYNRITDAGIDKVYYAVTVKDYVFIVLGDESEDNWDRPEYYEEQLAFVDGQLSLAEANGKPAFVVSHVPIAGVNGQELVWEDGCMREAFGDALKAIFESHPAIDIFFISGHMHEGINGAFTNEIFGVKNVETLNGVHYVNLPTYGQVNRYGVPWGGLGYQMEVYENSVIFRARDYASSKWYEGYEYSVTLK